MIAIHCKYDKLVSPKSLKPHPKNRNQHGSDQIDRLAKLIGYQGIRAPIVVSRLSGYIVKGHGTLMALNKLKIKEVPIVEQEFENEDAEYSFLTADNAIASWADLDLAGINQDLEILGPDFDLEMLGLKDFTVDVSEKYNEETEDEVPEPTKSISKLGDLYELGEHRLLCGDSTDKATVERLMNGEKADMVFTDPPYGMKVVKKDGNNNGLGEAIDGVVGVVGVAARGKYRPVIGDDSTKTAKDAFALCAGLEIEIQVFWGANFYADALPPSSGWIVWDKENGEGFFADGELAWTNDDKQLRIFRHQWKGMIRDSERGQKRVHPTQKPIALAEWCFDNYGKPKSVLDLFGGSGSTLIACEKTKRKCFMAELDPHYIDVIVSRWCKYTGNTSIKRNGEPMEWTVENLK